MPLRAPSCAQDPQVDLNLGQHGSNLAPRPPYLGAKMPQVGLKMTSWWGSWGALGVMICVRFSQEPPQDSQSDEKYVEVHSTGSPSHQKCFEIGSNMLQTLCQYASNKSKEIKQRACFCIARALPTQGEKETL